MTQFTIKADKTSMEIGECVKITASDIADFSLSADSLGKIVANEYDGTMATFIASKDGQENIIALRRSDHGVTAAVAITINAPPPPAPPPAQQSSSDTSTQASTQSKSHK